MVMTLRPSVAVAIAAGAYPLHAVANGGTSPGYSWSVDTDSGIDFNVSTFTMYHLIGGVAKMYVGPDAILFTPNVRLTVGSGIPLGFDSGTGNGDVFLARSAANKLALRNSTNVQEFQVNGTYTSATNFSHTAIKCNKTSVTASAGASVVATGAIPAKVQRIIGVSTKISTALGTGSGTTGYTVGDGSDVDRWGVVVGVATTISSDQDDYTADPIPAWSASAQDITLTASGGNFDGTGVIDVYVYYLDCQAD